MKMCVDKYPFKSFKNQRTPGRYMDGILHANLEILADVIVKDTTFLGIISSSTLEVGTGKSVLAQQLCEAWCELVNKKHGTNLEMSMKNVVFKPQDLIKRSFELPKYSPIILDEWEDIGYWTALGSSLREFFRKCRQLNLFMIIIIPNYFQLPMNYAISRSIFFVDVKFEGKFERGYFNFYNFKDKKNLYIKGKKTQNYDIWKPSFYGRFPDGYAVPGKEYRKVKLADMIKSESKYDVALEKEFIMKFCIKGYNLRIEIEDLVKLFKTSRATIYRWVDKNRKTITQAELIEEELERKDAEEKIEVEKEGFIEMDEQEETDYRESKDK